MNKRTTKHFRKSFLYVNQADVAVRAPDLVAQFPKLFVDGALMLDNTALEKIITCPRAASYYLVQKREADGTRDALNFGAAIHAALEVRYKSAGIYANDEVRTRSLDAIREHFEKEQQPADSWRTPDLAIRVIEKYFHENTTEIFRPYLDAVRQQPVVELPFAVVIGVIDDIPIVWMGRIDVVILMENDSLWLMDHKTTSILGPSYFSQFYNSGQFIGYTWAFRQLFGRKPQGVFINAIAIRKQTKTGKEIEFARERIPYTIEQVDEWQNNTLNIIATFLGYAKANYFPMHTAWCQGKFGTCQYFDVCTLPAAQRPILIGSRAYKDVTWSPLND